MPNMALKSNFAKYWIGLLLVGALNLAAAEKPADATLPVRGFCIAAPSGNRVDEFIKFIEEELAPRSANVLILRVDYGYQFLSRPEMADSRGLSKEQAQKIARVCKEHHIRVIPLINLLGHQSWQSSCGKLLRGDEERQIGLCGGAGKGVGNAEAQRKNVELPQFQHVKPDEARDSGHQDRAQGCSEDHDLARRDAIGDSASQKHERSPWNRSHHRNSAKHNA